MKYACYNETGTHFPAVLVNSILEDDLLGDREMSTELQTESSGSEATTTSEVWTTEASSSSLPYKIAVVVIGVMGALSNGFVLLGFCQSGRSKMASSMVYIANHTTLEQSTS